MIIAKERFSVLGEGYDVIEEIKGSDLVGLSYEPLFPFLKDNLADSEKSKLEKAFKVYEADFVTTTDGTGVVHIAPMYGQDDFALGTANGLPKQHTVKADGTFYEWCGKYAGRFVKEVDEKGKPLVAVDIINDLKENNLFFKQENYSHSYPHCWRCKTPLIYYARDSWYIAVSKLRDKLVAENENINWEPEYIKEGRFGEWLREIKDWAISRERYWGTPLPVWINEAGDKRIIVDGVDTLKKYTRKSGNTYKLMRHGKTEKNELSVWDCNPKSNAHLSEEGKRGVIEAVERLKEEGCAPDMVFVSPFLRTEETMRIVCDALNIPKENIFEDPRLVEWYVGSEWNGKSIEGYFAALYDSFGKDFHYSKFGDGETYADVVKRAGEFLYEVDAKYKNKKILIVSHASVLKAFSVLGNVLDTTSIAAFHNEYPKYKNSEIRNLDFVPLPHNENYEIDLHRPFIDEIVLVDEDGVEYRRTKEVMDVWFDSGAMPFAQDATFGNKRHDFAYPADFISEAIDQTRGWFYTLHAVGVLMGKGNAYKNVICLGHLLDKNGKKMSKSLGNVVDPWEQINKFGIDAIRLWMYSVNQPGESKNYDEKTVDEINKKIFNLITNVHTFYELYRDTALESNNYPVSRDVMDRWILEKLNILVQRIVKNMDAYKLLEPVREIRDFVADLSTWYLQLSRDRFRDGDQEAKTTLYFVLKTIVRVLAPFAPFYAEDLYLKLRIESDVESVHLESFPEGTGEDEDTDLLIDMEKTRKIVSLALEARQTVGIKVRQPLSKLKIKDQKSKVGDEFSVLIKERVNVKDIIVDGSIQNEVELDTEITNGLREEGIVREIIRAVQDLRKSKGLTPSDPIILNIGANEKGKDVLEKPEWIVMIRDAVLAKNIEVKTITEGEKIVIDDVEFTIALV